MKLLRLLRFTSIALAVVLTLSFASVYAVWTYTQNNPAPVSQKLSVGIAPWQEMTEQSVNIADKFQNILNRKESCRVTINGTTYTDSFDALIAAFNSSPTASWTGITLHNNSYIGTMQTRGDDVKALRALFGDSLTAEEEASADYTLMLKREPIDGNQLTGMSYYMDGDHGWREENAFYPGSEMILFSTNWQRESYVPSGYVIVYATVYTRQPKTDKNGNPLYELDARGNIQYYTYQNQYGTTVTTNYPIYQYNEWQKVSGDSGFVGYAQVVDYSTGDKSQSFATGTWTSINVYGTAPAGSSLSQVIQALPKQ